MQDDRGVRELLEDLSFMCEELTNKKLGYQDVQSLSFARRILDMVITRTDQEGSTPPLRIVR